MGLAVLHWGMATLKDAFENISQLSIQKSTIDGHDIEHVFYVAGGFGGGSDSASKPEDAIHEGAEETHVPLLNEIHAETEEAEETAKGAYGFGGGGSIIPLGAYFVEDGKLTFHPNPITATVVGLPFFVVGALVVKRLLKTIGK